MRRQLSFEGVLREHREPPAAAVSAEKGRRLAGRQTPIKMRYGTKKCQQKNTSVAAPAIYKKKFSERPAGRVCRMRNVASRFLRGRAKDLGATWSTPHA
jgi:hypothetical protein